jgi:hypothetical protein
MPPVRARVPQVASAAHHLPVQHQLLSIGLCSLSPDMSHIEVQPLATLMTWTRFALL